MDNVNKWLTLTANLGVILGIVILAFELNQTNELMESEARQSWNEYVGESYLTLAENGELAAILVKDQNNETLTELERFRFIVFWGRVFNINNLAFNELPPSDLKLQEENIRANFELFPSLAEVWESRRHRYSSDFVSWMDEIKNSP